LDFDRDYRPRSGVFRLKPLFDFAGDSALGQWVANSRYAFPAFEMLHLLGLGLLLGSILLFNAHAFGLGMRRQSSAELSDDFAPWIKLALLLMAVSGVPMFASKAHDLWNEELAAYTIKMSLIVLGVVLHYTVQVPRARAGSNGRWTAALALLVWFSAALAGLSLEFL
jgi:hypothetical protein